jgi:GT2 family glycosyltransferase
MSSKQDYIEPDIHISVVSHNHWHLVENLFHDLDCLASKVRFQVTLTLNIAEQTTIDLSIFSFPITVITNEYAKGFGENHNQAFKQFINSQNRHYFFVINPDVRIKEDIFITLAKNLHLISEIGIIAPLVKSYEGEIEDSCRNIPTPWRIVKKALGSHETNKCLHQQENFETDWTAGMFLGFRSEVFEQLKGFDESYFLYYEDVDICS